MKVIATALGMSVDSDENALAVRAGKLSADVDELAKANMAKDTEIVKLRTELAAAETAKAQAEKASRDIECDALIEKLSKEGRVTPGGEREKFLRMLYAKGQHELAQQVAASYGEGAPIVPVGDKQQAYRGTGSSAKRLDGVPQTSDGKVDFAKLVEALPPEVRAGVANLNPEDVVRGNRQRIEGILNISLEGV